MGVIIHYKGGQRAVDTLDAAVDWSFGPLTIRLWGENRDDGPLVEFDMSEIAYLEQSETPLARPKTIQHGAA